MERDHGPFREETAHPADCIRLNPEIRLCTQWDTTGIRTYPLASRPRMGFQVLDDVCLEHIM